MEIEFSKNQFWKSNIDQPDFQTIEKELEDGWHTWEPSFVKDYTKKKEFKRMEKWAREIQQQGVKHLIVIGIGGSSLGAKALQKYSLNGSDKLVFLEGPHPQILKQYSKILKEKDIAILWVSKSGSTLESLTNLSIVREFFKNIPEYFITSNPEKLNKLCNDPERIFMIPKDLGGRFSVVSSVGIMPGLFAGLPMNDFLRGFQNANDSFHISIPIFENHAKIMALELYSMLQSGYHGIVFWIYSCDLRAWGDWVVQLWGESLGKKTNIQALPYVARGPEDQHSLLQYFMAGPNKYIHIFTHTKSYDPINIKLPNTLEAHIAAGHSLYEILQAQMSSIESALSEEKRPVSQYMFPLLYKELEKGWEADMWLMGKWMGYWMYIVTYLGYLFKVNPFDQPAVEKGKIYCKEMLDGKRDIDFLKDYTEI